jgi:hypothetical protein
MFNTGHPTPLFAAPGRLQALEAWREAVSLVRIRWRVFLEADPASRSSAFASYVAALDAEEVAVFELAALSPFAHAA